MSYASEQAVLNGQWNAAEAAFQAELKRQAPHVLMRPRVYPDGNAWCALYGEDLVMGVAGFGDTPEEACADFDRNWSTQRLAKAEAHPAPAQNTGKSGISAEDPA